MLKKLVELLPNILILLAVLSGLYAVIGVVKYQLSDEEYSASQTNVKLVISDINALKETDKKTSPIIGRGYMVSIASGLVSGDCEEKDICVCVRFGTNNPECRPVQNEQIKNVESSCVKPDKNKLGIKSDGGVLSLEGVSC